MKPNWLITVDAAIKAEAEYAVESCKEIAKNQEIEIDYVLEVFDEQFGKMKKKVLKAEGWK